MKTTLLFASLISIAMCTASASGGTPAQSQARDLGTVNVQPPPKPFSGQQAITLLSLETDLTPRQVRQIARHEPAEAYHFMSEIKADQQFRQALGEARYTAFFNNEPIELYSDKVREAASAMTASTTASQPGAGFRIAVAGR